MARPRRGPPRRGGSPTGGRRGPSPYRRPSPHNERRDAEAAAECFVRARMMLAQEHFEDARALAGEGVRLDPQGPEGYLIIADALAAEGDVEDAIEAYARAERKAERAHEDVLRCEALWGRARILMLMEQLELAAGVLRQLLKASGDEAVGIAQLLGEVYLRLGHSGKTLEVVRDGDGRGDGHLLRALALFDREQVDDAVLEARRALLANPNLVAALHGEEPADHGIAEHLERESVEEAFEFVERLGNFLEARPDHVDRVIGVACLPTVMAEVKGVVDLLRELSEAENEEEFARIEDLLDEARDPGRLSESEDEVLAEYRRDQAEESEGDGYEV